MILNVAVNNFRSGWGESSGVEPGLHIHAETPHAVGLEQATIPGADLGFLEREF